VGQLTVRDLVGMIFAEQSGRSMVHVPASTTTTQKGFCMSNLVSSAWWIIPAGLVAMYVYERFSWSARTSRRRRRSHYRLASKSKRPTVTFMVSTR